MPERDTTGHPATLTPGPLTVDACVGTKGTTFLTPQVWLAHLAEGEAITGMRLIEVELTPEFATAVRDLQRQHDDMLRFLEQWVIEDHNEWCDEVEDPAEDCIRCAYDAMTAQWEAGRVE